MCLPSEKSKLVIFDSIRPTIRQMAPESQNSFCVKQAGSMPSMSHCCLMAVVQHSLGLNRHSRPRPKIPVWNIVKIIDCDRLIG